MNAPDAPDAPDAAAIAAEQNVRQIAASKIGAVFNSLHEYVNSIQQKNADGVPLMSQQLIFAHHDIDTAAMWTIKHVLTYGTPPQPVAPEDTNAPASSPGATT